MFERIKTEDFIKIEQSMISELHLSGNDLVVFAFINGFTKGAEHIYRGGLDYLCKRTGISRRTAIYVLEKLTERGLLIKSTVLKGKMTYCTYKTKWCKSCTSAKDAPMQNSSDSSADIASISSAGIAPNKKAENKSKGESKTPSRSFSGCDNPNTPTIVEIEEYALQTNSPVIPQKFFNHFESIGWVTNYGLPIKNWKKVFDNWTMTENRKDAPKRNIKKDNRGEEYVEYLRTQGKL